MEKLKRILVIFAIVIALCVGIVVTAFAGEASDSVVYSTELEEAKAKLEANTPLREYDLPVIVNKLTWDEGTAESKKAPYGLSPLQGAGACNDIGPEYEENGNGHFTIRYYGEKEKEWEKTNSALHTYAFLYVNKRNLKGSFVMEFDLTTFGDSLPTGMAIEHSSVSADNGGRAQPGFFRINPNGTIKPFYDSGSSKSGYALSTEESARLDAVKINKGEWTHFSMIFDPDTCFFELYVNYEYVCKLDTRPKSVTTYQLDIFRFGTANTELLDGEVSIDNFIAYEGGHIRTPDLLQNMSDHDKFSFYVSYMAGTHLPSTDRLVAYNGAQKLVGNYVDYNGEFIPVVDADIENIDELNAKLLESVNKFNNFVENEYEELHNALKLENLKLFGEKVSAAEAVTRSLATLADREKNVIEIEDFLKNNSDNILMSGDSDYVEFRQRYDTLVYQYNSDKNILSFITTVDRFYSAINFSIETLSKHYGIMDALVKEGIDQTVIGAPGFEEYTAAYDRYLTAGEILTQKQYDSSAKKIIDCVSFISEYDTEEEWIANYEYINRFVIIIREEIRAGKYNADFDGIVEAISFFNRVDGYFYNLLQIEYFEYISSMLEKYNDTDGYVEKMGLCAHLRSYIAASDIDPNNKDISNCILMLDIYESELEQYKVDYNEVLVQNTIYFKNLMQSIGTASGYAEIYSIYAQARDLYFAMNVGDASIAEELVIYDELGKYVTTVEESSAAFLVAVEILRAATTEDEIYAALVDCYRYYENAESDIDGVKEAADYYLAAYDNYNASIAGVNAAIKDVNVLSVGSLRANCGVNEIVAVIVKKVNEED